MENNLDYIRPFALSWYVKITVFMFIGMWIIVLPVFRLTHGGSINRADYGIYFFVNVFYLAITSESLWRGRKWIWWWIQYYHILYIMVPIARALSRTTPIIQLVQFASLSAVFPVSQDIFPYEFFDTAAAPLFLWYFFRRNVMEFFRVADWPRWKAALMLVLVEATVFLAGALLRILHLV